MRDHLCVPYELAADSLGTATSGVFQSVMIKRFGVSPCVSVSHATWGSAGGCEGHLRAAVVVEFAHAGAAYSTVGVSMSICMPVPETPDVALWADRGHSVRPGIQS